MYYPFIIFVNSFYQLYGIKNKKIKTLLLITTIEPLGGFFPMRRENIILQKILNFSYLSFDKKDKKW
jgi:hypothetical protein